MRLKKTLRGNTISADVVQINLKVLKQGEKKLIEIFPEQAKSKKEIAEGEKQEKAADKSGESGQA